MERTKLKTFHFPGSVLVIEIEKQCVFHRLQRNEPAQFDETRSNWVPWL